MKVTEMKYLAMLPLTETKVSFVFPPDKFLTTVKKQNLLTQEGSSGLSKNK